MSMAKERCENRQAVNILYAQARVTEIQQHRILIAVNTSAGTVSFA